jgi:Glycosyl hydrolase family 26
VVNSERPGPSCRLAVSGFPLGCGREGAGGRDPWLSSEGHFVGGTAVSSDSERIGRHRQAMLRSRRRGLRLAVVLAVVAVIAAVIAASPVHGLWQQTDPSPSLGRDPLPTTSGSYLGVYRQGVPSSYAPVTAFTAATGISPDVVTYYSSWGEPFQARFAGSVAKHGAVPLVQINPLNIRLAAISSGQYDRYLSSYAEALRTYGHPVILSFGHEMNGSWYSWGFKHTAPAVFVAAWRHIVEQFRRLGVRNVTWMWTINVIHTNRRIPSPAPWWPGTSYVNWVGMDGYYYDPSWTFTSLFGPTIAVVRELTHDPILIAETAAAPATIQPAKIADLFQGVRTYGLLGFVWFDVSHPEQWALNSPAAISALRRGAKSYQKRSS